MHYRLAQGLVLIALLATASLAHTAAPTGAEADRFFEEKVRPILQANCIKCHGGEKTKAGLTLTTARRDPQRRRHRPGRRRGRPGKSLLRRRRSATERQAADAAEAASCRRTQIDVLTKWVEMGLPWPAGPTTRPAAASRAAAHGPPKVDDKARQFWSFQPVVRPAVPQVEERGVGHEPDRRVHPRRSSKRRASRPPRRPTRSR